MYLFQTLLWNQSHVPSDYVVLQALISKSGFPLIKEVRRCLNQIWNHFTHYLGFYNWMRIFNTTIITHNSIWIQLLYQRLENNSTLSVYLFFYLHTSLRINSSGLNMMTPHHHLSLLLLCQPQYKTFISCLREQPQIPTLYLHSHQWEVQRKK